MNQILNNKKYYFSTWLQQLGKSSKLYLLLVVSTLTLSVFFDAWDGNWRTTMLSALAIVSIADIIGILSKSYPGVLRNIGWTLLLLLFLITLVGFFS